jgi:uncharacterized protein YukE
MATVTEQDRVEWARSPVTQELLQQFQASRQDAMEAWAGEAFVGQSAEQGQIQNATAIGGVRVLNDLIAQIVELQQTEVEGDIA